MARGIDVVKQFGVFPVGGPGTYIFEGKSGSGKNYLLGFMLHKALQHLKPSNIVTYSETSEETDSLDFIENLYPDRVERWGKAFSVEDLMHVIEYRKTMVAKLKTTMVDEWKQWLKDNPILMIVDDIGGKTSTSNSTKNPWYTLVTTVRHLGIYLVILTQYQKQLGPAFTGNTRAIISFDRSKNALKHFSESAGQTINSDEIRSLQDFLREEHSYLVWWQTWMLQENFNIKERMPEYPWLGDPVDKRSHTALVLNEIETE